MMLVEKIEKIDSEKKMYKHDSLIRFNQRTKRQLELKFYFIFLLFIPLSFLFYFVAFSLIFFFLLTLIP